MWTVILTKTPVVNDYRADYFPRTVRYKRDAQVLKAEVERKGGAATVQKAATR